jgi:hypothetical protein
MTNEKRFSAEDAECAEVAETKFPIVSDAAPSARNLRRLPAG